MFGTREQHFSDDGCSHSNTVDNYSDGDQVCTDCGLVLEQLYTNAAFPISEKKPMINNFIADVCMNACIAQSVSDYAISYFETLKKILGSKYKDEAIAAYAIYEALNRQEVPRTAQEIEHFTGVKLKKLFKIEASLSLPDTLNENPSDYVTRYCALLALDYSAQTVIQTMVKELQDTLGNLKCNCLVAVIIHLYCRYHDKKISLKSICNICCISATSVHRVVRKLKSREISSHPLIVQYVAQKKL